MRLPVRLVFSLLACAFVAAVPAVVAAPQSVFPDIALDRVEVFASAGELPAERVRAEVAAPLEAALANLPGLRTTRTFADPGELELELDFDGARPQRDDLLAVRDVANGLRTRLPVTDVTTLLEGPEAEPVLSYAIVASSISQAELGRRVERSIPTVFGRVPGAGRFTVFAGPRAALEVRIPARTLFARGLSPREVAVAIAAANETHVPGVVSRGEERLRVVTGGLVRDVPSLGDVRVDGGRSGAPVSLRSIATVRAGEEPTGRQASFDGVHAVILNAYATTGGDAVTLRREVEARLPALRATLPADASVTTSWDQTRLIEASQRALRLDMALGAAIALLVIAAFLRDLALTLVAAIVLPLALAFSTFALVRAGLHLDLMTLGGLAIAIGLIVDEVIVVIEAIARGLDGAPAARHAAIDGAVRRIAKPLVASTAANLVVFLPLAFLSGVPGFFFRALAITLGIALVVSIALSLFVAPALAERLGVRGSRVAAARPIERAYIASLRWMLRHAWPVVSAAAAVVVVSFVVLARLPSNFLPDVDEGQFEIKYAMPPGMSLAAADTLATTIERTLLLDRSVAHVARLSGVDTNGYVATPPDAGTMRVTVAPGPHSHFDELADRARESIANVNGYVAVEVHQLLEDQIDDLAGAPEPVVVTVSGPDQARLASIAAAVADRVTRVPGAVDVFDGVTWEPRSLHAVPRPGDRTTPQAFADEVRARTGGITASTTEEDALPIVVHVDDSEALERRVSLGKPDLTSTIRELDGERVVLVTADLDRVDLSTSIATLRRLLEPLIAALPAGYRVEIGGAIVAQRAAFVEFATIFAVALALIFVVLVATFDSFRIPLVVLAAIPLTPIGVAVALALTRTSLNVASFMGMLLLVGIVVRNGILLVDSANRRVRETGATPHDAVERAALERLRPILMTTFATLGALAPLAAGLGAGSEMERPLAIAVIGGIVAATALTLAVVPVLYVASAGQRAAVVRE